MTPPLIEVRGLSYRYPDGTPALDQVDFQLDDGETVALLGANGSGKTTFVLHLNGLLAGEGSIRVCGEPLTRESLARARQKIGLVFQDSDSQFFMPTVLEDVAFGPLNLGLEGPAAAARARAALAEVGMSAAEQRAPWHLSAGEKKRVAIAGILAMRPEILVLDEPTTFLDPPAECALVELAAGAAAGQNRGDTRCPLRRGRGAKGGLLRQGNRRRGGSGSGNRPPLRLDRRGGAVSSLAASPQWKPREAQGTSTTDCRT